MGLQWGADLTVGMRMEGQGLGTQMGLFNPTALRHCKRKRW